MCFVLQCRSTSRSTRNTRILFCTDGGRKPERKLGCLLRCSLSTLCYLCCGRHPDWRRSAAELTRRHRRGEWHDDGPVELWRPPPARCESKPEPATKKEGGQQWNRIDT